MGSLQSKYEEIDCKNIRNCQIEFVAFAKTDSENFHQDFKVVKFYKCDHDNSCGARTSLEQISKFTLQNINYWF